MARSDSPVISPILADLSQDIAGAIPLELILLWSTGSRTSKKHGELLAPHVRKGTVVSSDASGLSKLSSQKTLLEVMQLVGQPKEVIYGYGKAVGGEAIGVWAADNTQMYYSDAVQARDVVEAMIASQQEIQKNLPVQVGMGIHQGVFIEIGGGLYGKDAHHVEELAESHTQAGEIAVTYAVKKSLGKEYSKSLLKHQTYPKAFSLQYKQHIHSLQKHTESQYPQPFDKSFGQLLSDLSSLSSTQVQEKYQSFAQQKVVILIKITHRTRTLLLDQLTDFIVANAYIKQVSKEFSDVLLIKSNGDLGIFVSGSDKEAQAFAENVFEKLRGNDFVVNIGLSKGEVLLFPMQDGYEIAGGPVNIASKIAEDGEEVNRILVEESVVMKDGNFTPFSFTISKVEIKGKYLR